MHVLRRRSPILLISIYVLSSQIFLHIYKMPPTSLNTYKVLTPKHRFLLILFLFLVMLRPFTLTSIKMKVYRHVKNISTHVITSHHLLTTRLFDLVLSLNAVNFNGTFYKQILGIRMGTCAAPSMANLFMGSLEHKILNSTQNRPLPGSWKRYIDDVNFLWTDGLDSLQQFQTYLNNFHPTIRFALISRSPQLRSLTSTPSPN